MVSRAPAAQIATFRARMGWEHVPWYSSEGSDFNYDFHSTQDEGKKRVCYNWMDKGTLEGEGLGFREAWKRGGLGDK